MVPGLEYSYYEGNWSKLPQFDTLNPVKTGSVERFKLPFEGKGDTLGFAFKGYITVPEDGVYTFFTRSDGFSSLSIGSTGIIHNGGSEPIRERCGFIALKAGMHPIEVTFFTKEGCSTLEVFYKGPGMDRREIPAEILGYPQP